MNAEEPKIPVPIPSSAAQIKQALETSFNGSFDFKIKQFENDTVLMAFLEGFVNKELVSAAVVRPIIHVIGEIEAGERNKKTIAYVKSKITSACGTMELTDFNDCILSILAGCTIVFVDGDATGLKIDLRDPEKRSIEESPSEAVSRGSREGFTETLMTNTSMLRRIIKDSNLVFEKTQVGRVTKTNVAICYLKGLANQEIIDEVRKRVRNIKTEAILETGYIEEEIEDAPLSIFPTIFNSERPDAIAGKILEGRVAILCEGTPSVLTVPNLFVDYLQYSEDYNNRWVFSGIIRFSRFIAFLISTMAPAYYIALLSFHQDVIPFKLLLTIMKDRKGVPLSPLVETLVLLLLFEIIKESGLRMTRAIGQSVSIVGGLIVGQAAVEAGMASTPAVVVVAAASVCAFVVAKLDAPVFIMRVSLMFIANSIGILGVVLGSIGFLIYMTSLKSFGVPYFSPIAPLDGHDLQDTVLRLPLWTMLRRPETITRRYGKNDLRNKRND